MVSRRKKKLLTCGNCDGGLMLEDPSYGLVCPRCQIRVAGPFESAHEIPDYVPASTTRRHARKRKPKTRDEIRTERLKVLQDVMKDATGEPAWLDTDVSEIEKWISVDDDLSDRAWIDAAKNQLVDQSVSPEHAGAAPSAVYRWNDVFISTYLMNVDQGMSREEAIDSASQNASDTIKLTARERGMINRDPDLYKNP